MAEAVKSDRGADDPFRHYPPQPPSGKSIEITLEALRALPASIAAAIADASDERLSARPSEDQWCTKEHVEHLIDGDALGSQRIAAILAEDSPTLVNRDVDAENRKIFDAGAREARIESLLSRLRDGRADLVALVEDVPHASWSRTGEHDLYGPISVYQVARHVVCHDYNHLQAVRRLLGN
jgi:hypothetical protein